MNPLPASISDSNDAKKFYGIALSMVNGIGHLTAKTLVGYCGGYEEVFTAKSTTLRKIPGIGDFTIESLRHFKDFSKVEMEIGYLEKNNIDVIFYSDKRYPQRLLHFNDSPFMLQTKGRLELNPAKTIGIVGTRTPTMHGLQWTNDLIGNLSEAGITIISGFAYGIDITAHKASIKHKMPNIGVLAGGFNTIYPAAHKKYMDDVMTSGGFISESGFMTLPDKARFPMRNRIIAGLSDGLIVVESGESGGSMITADFAFGYDKTLMAVPGKPSDPNSGGCNKLIKEQKASLIEDAQDVIKLMNYDLPQHSALIDPVLFRQLTPKEESVLSLLKNKRDCHIDEIIQILKIRNSELASVILTLTLEGLVIQLPGSRLALA